MDVQLKRGILNICILKLLEKEKQYGYELVKTMQQFFPDTDESTLYAILRRLNKEGLTNISYGEAPNGPVRKYYSITDMGKKYLDEYIESWRHIEEIFAQIGLL